jgi:hypothetical protein
VPENKSLRFAPSGRARIQRCGELWCMSCKRGTNGKQKARLAQLLHLESPVVLVRRHEDGCGRGCERVYMRESAGAR